MRDPSAGQEIRNAVTRPGGCARESLSDHPPTLDCRHDRAADRGSLAGAQRRAGRFVHCDDCRHARRPRDGNAGLLPLHRVRAQGERGGLSRHRLSLHRVCGIRTDPRRQLRQHPGAPERGARGDPQARRASRFDARKPDHRGRRRDRLDRGFLPETARATQARRLRGCDHDRPLRVGFREAAPGPDQADPALVRDVLRAGREDHRREDGAIFVCQICGSTVNAIPADTCPICKNPSTHYRKVEPPV